MKRFALPALLVLAIAPGLQAQAAAVFPDQPLEANRATVRDAVYVLRDTLQPVIATIARLERDFRRTSPQLMSSRARELAASCTAAGRNIAPARGAVVKTKVDSKLKRAQQVRLQAALDSLALSMTRCSTEFAEMSKPGKGEEVRGYGNRRAQPVRAEILSYESAVDGFFRAMAIPHRPLGARPDPLAH